MARHRASKAPAAAPRSRIGRRISILIAVAAMGVGVLALASTRRDDALLDRFFFASARSARDAGSNYDRMAVAQLQVAEANEALLQSVVSLNAANERLSDLTAAAQVSSRELVESEFEQMRQRAAQAEERRTAATLRHAVEVQERRDMFKLLSSVAQGIVFNALRLHSTELSNRDVEIGREFMEAVSVYDEGWKMDLSGAISSKILAVCPDIAGQKVRNIFLADLFDPSCRGRSANSPVCAIEDYDTRAALQPVYRADAHAGYDKREREAQELLTDCACRALTDAEHSREEVCSVGAK